MSETTRALVRGDEPASGELVDLGEHHLKDLDHPERLYQLVAPGLPADFAAPRSLDTHTAPDVPLPALRIPTRERELAEGALAAVRDLELLGPAIERQGEEMLRTAGIPDTAPVARPAPGRRSRAVGWAVAGVLLAAVAVWLVLRVL